MSCPISNEALLKALAHTPGSFCHTGGLANGAGRQGTLHATESPNGLVHGWTRKITSSTSFGGRVKQPWDALELLLKVTIQCGNPHLQNGGCRSMVRPIQADSIMNMASGNTFCSA
eukprot:scaffold90828_cov39-Prasinocladus_malaysianus.AAC.1